MARKCKIEDPNRFVLTLPLCCEPWQRDQVDKLFRVGNEIKNHLIAYEKKQLGIVTRRKDYRALQTQLADAYKAKDEKLIKELGKQRTSLLESAGFSAGAFETQANKYRLHYCARGGKGCMIHSHVSQKIAASVWSAFEDYFYGSGKEICFSKWTEFTTLSCKEAGTGFIYRGNGIVEINKMVLHASVDKKDRYGYQEEALKQDVRFCSIVRRWYENGWKYFLQLVLVGKPPVKVRPETGELLHPLGKGRVGHDIGTQTLASCGEEAIQLVELG